MNRGISVSAAGVLAAVIIGVSILIGLHWVAANQRYRIKLTHSIAVYEVDGKTGAVCLLIPRTDTIKQGAIRFDHGCTTQVAR